MRNLANHVGVIKLYEAVETRDCVYVFMEAAARGCAAPARHPLQAASLGSAPPPTCTCRPAHAALLLPPCAAFALAPPAGLRL